MLSRPLKTLLTSDALGANELASTVGASDFANDKVERNKVDGGPCEDCVFGGEEDDVEHRRLFGDVDGEVKGNDGDDIIDGGLDNSNFFEGDGNDVVRGGRDDDWIYEDYDPNSPQLSPVTSGNDVIFGDLGNDNLVGQGGAHTFCFGIETAGIVDTIRDWTPSQGDRIDLTAFDAQPGSPFATGVVTDLASLTMVQVGSNTEIMLPTGQKIVLKNTTAANILPSNFIGKASIDRIGNDLITANSLGEQLNGCEDDDTTTGSFSADNIDGNTGREKVDGGLGDIRVFRGEDNVVEHGLLFNDDDYLVMGGEGDDCVYGDLGEDLGL